MANNLSRVQAEVLYHLLSCCLVADQAGAVAVLNESPLLLSRWWAGDTIYIGQRRWIHEGMAALHAGSWGGSEGLVRELLDRGANLQSVGSSEWTALHFAARGGHYPVATLLLDRGVDLHALDDLRCTALHIACFNDHLDCAVLMLSRGSDLMAIGNKGVTALSRYAHWVDPPLSEQVKNLRRLILRNAFAEGPHPTQVQRRRDERWARRWSLMCVLTGCDLMPLAYRKAQLLVLNPPLLPAAVIPPQRRRIRLTRAQTIAERARLMGLVLSNEGLVRLVVSYL